MFEEMLAEYTEMSARALHAAIEDLELEARALEARRLAARAAADAQQVPALDGHKSMQAYLRATCNQPSLVALSEVRRARICRDFPQIGEALMVGRIGVGQVDELVRIQRNQRAAKYLSDAAVDALLDHAEHLPIGSFTAVVERWELWADPDGAWRDQTESIDNRSAHVVAANGEVVIGVSGGDALTAEKLRNIFAHFLELEFRKDCEARRAIYGEHADDHPLPRTDAQRRFDAFVAIFERAYTATGDGKMPAAMLTRRCETTSGQQIPAQLLIQALLTAQVRRVVLDANSTVIDLGERKRLFTGNSRIAATLLDPTCQHLGCEVPADRCQIDHNESHSQGGRTDQSNAGPLCGPHNRFKYTQGWRTRRADNGRIYNIRADGTMVLFVGERPPPFKSAVIRDEIRELDDLDDLDIFDQRFTLELLDTG